MTYEIDTRSLPRAEDFQGPEFVAEYKPQLEAYVELRVAGRTSLAALRVSFGEAFAASVHSQAYIDFIECTRFYIRGFKAALAAIKPSEAWTANLAIQRLRSIADDSDSNGNTRVNAIKELNVLTGVTVVDENGKTRATKNLNDFYDAIQPMDAETAAARRSALYEAGMTDKLSPEEIVDIEAGKKASTSGQSIH